MSIKSGFDSSNRTTVQKELTFPALYVWTVPKDMCYGQVNLFIDEISGFCVVVGKGNIDNLGYFNSSLVSCTDPKWRRLAVGERIYLENED
jgi:hypothetical protein